MAMRGTAEQPQGFIYQANFISPQQEQELLGFVAFVDFHEVIMHGQTARRVVRNYGYSYDFMTRSIEPGEPIPEELSWLRERVEEFAKLPPGAFVEALVTKYPRGATIGWHRDAGAFGEAVVGVSLASPAVIRFQRGKGAERRVYERIVNPRSSYILSGDSRYKWEHSIPPTKQDRYSITFRTLRGGPDG